MDSLSLDEYQILIARTAGAGGIYIYGQKADFSRAEYLA